MQKGNYKSGIYVHLLVQFYHTIFLPFTRHYSSVVDTLFSLLMVLPRLLSFETFEWKLCSARVGSLFRFAKYASFDCLPLWSQLGAPHGIRRSYGGVVSGRKSRKMLHRHSSICFTENPPHMYGQFYKMNAFTFFFLLPAEHFANLATQKTLTTLQAKRHTARL